MQAYYCESPILLMSAYTAGPLLPFDFSLRKGLRIGNTTTKDIQYMDQKPPGCVELHFLGILFPRLILRLHLYPSITLYIANKSSLFKRSPSIWSEIPALFLTVGAVYGGNTTVVNNALFPGFYDGTMLGSVITPGPTATVHKVGCPTDAVCLYPMPMVITAGPSTFAATYTQKPINDMAHTNGDIITRVGATYAHNCTLYKRTEGSYMLTATGTTVGHPAAPMYKTSATAPYTFPVQGWASVNLLTTVDSYSVVTLTGSQAAANTGGDAYFDVNRGGGKKEWRQSGSRFGCRFGRLISFMIQGKAAIQSFSAYEVA